MQSDNQHLSPIHLPSQGRMDVEAAGRGTRLDIWLSRNRTEHSRARWQSMIREGQVRVNGAAVKGSHRLAGAETVTWEELPPTPSALVPEARDLNVIFEDADLLVLNKQADLVIHPAPGHDGGTLVNALLHYCGDELAGIGGERRPGIVHRLDKDTTGVLIIAKSERAHRLLVEQFKSREVRKQYAALIWGAPEPQSGTIRTLIGRSEHDRKKMSTQVEIGRTAISHYRTVEALERSALVEIDIETGRTHQIRVHMAHIGHPIIGDPLYGGHRSENRELGVSRQMLHAHHIAFTHPCTGEELEFEAPLPEDMRALIVRLRKSPA